MLVELPDLHFVEAAGDIRGDGSGVGACFVRADGGEVGVTPLSWGAIPALDSPVKPAYDSPFQAVQQAVGRTLHCWSTISGIGTARSTRGRMVSASRSSASASYDRTIRWRSTSRAISSMSM